jgi:uncharacterized membrane protein YccC
MSKLEQSEKKSAISPYEVRRFKRAMWTVLFLGLSVLAAIFYYGDAPRPLIDRMNPILGCVVAFAFGVFLHAMWRFRKHCGTWPGRLTTRSS